MWQNTVLDADNATLRPGASATSAAARLAGRALERRGAEYDDEIRRLLDAALEVMRRRGTATRPRVADIVAAAGLSNDAFYRHFRSKDELVGAVIADGAERLTSYLAHQMGKERTPEAQVRRWVEGVLSQAEGTTAATTVAVLANAGAVADGMAAGRHPASEPVGALLRAPLTEMGSDDPELVASLVAHAVLGTLSDHLWQRAPFTRREVERVTAFALAAARRK